MKKIALYTMMLGLGSLALTSCGDAMDEITSLTLDRDFAPIGLEAKSATENSITLEWTKSHENVTYTIEIFADDSLSFAGSATNTITGVEVTKLKVSGLVYDTKYSARVMTIDNDNSSRNSKWSNVFFRTSAQQIFETPTENDIADRSVIMTWPAGETATSVRVYADESLVKEQTLTADEVAAGKVTVTGLQPETTYAIRLYNGEKQRGSKTVTTIADLNGATLVREGDDIRALIEAAEDGAVFALYGGTHVIADLDEEGKAGAAKVSKSIVIKGIYPTNVPIVKGRFEILDGASLELNQIILDGKDNSSTDQAFNFKTADVTYPLLSIQNSEVRNFGKGVYYLNVASTVNKLVFANTIIHDIVCDGGDMFDCRKGRIDELSFINCAMYNSCAARDFIRMDDASKLGGTPTITVDHCTINACANASGKRLLYVRYVGNVIKWTNNLVTNIAGVWSNQSKTAVPEFSNNAYYNCPKLNVLDGADAGKTNYFIDEASKAVDDPKYTDADNGNFGIGNEDVSKLGVGCTLWNVK
ncbi:MAG: DUF4957 domain-containing protein [Prevotella sp.]